jgi:hypothetical protein
MANGARRYFASRGRRLDHEFDAAGDCRKAGGGDDGIGNAAEDRLGETGARAC